MLNMSSELWNYHDRDLSLESLVILWEQKVLEEAEEAKHEPKERTVTVAKLTEGVGLEAGIKGFEDVCLMKQRTVTTRQGINEFVCLIWGDSKVHEEIFLSPEFSVWFLQVIIRDTCIGTWIDGQRRWWSRSPSYISRGSISCLNSHLFVISHIFKFLSLWMYQLLFKILCL